MTKSYQKKIKLGVHTRRTKWAPVWAVVRAFGKGKRKHPAEITSIRRSWRTSRLKVKPRNATKSHLG